MENLKVLQLKAIAKKHDIKSFSKMKRDDLIAALQDIDILEESIEDIKYKCQHGKIKY